MSQGKTHATEVQKQTAPARQLEQEVTRQPEQGPVQQVAPQVAYRRAQMNRNRLRPEDLLALQRTVGNREVRRTVANIMPYRRSNGAMTDIHEYKQSVEADSREHANIVQTQSSGHRTVQQPLDPTNPSAWSLLGRSDFRQLFPEEFEAILGAAPAAGTGAQQTITEAGIPESKEQSAIFEHRLRRLVRMNALGLMASHRATIEGKRDRVLSSLNQPTAPARHAMQAATESEQPNQEEILQAIRAAAKSIAFLNILKKELERYHTTLNILEGSVLINSRTESRIESWLGRMRNSTVPYCSDEIASYFNERIMTLGSIRNLDLVGAALSIMARNLKDWRQHQIDGVNVALYHLYDKFPFFTQLPAEDIITGKSSLQSNTGLVKGVNTAFTDLLEKIDKAIIQIGSEDIHPFDMPEAVKAAKTNLPDNLQPFVDRVLRDRQVVQFWKSMGLTLLQTVLVFVPVIGPFAAAGLGAITLGADLESALDRYALAQASDQPDRGVLGVTKPGSLEWTMLAVQAALTLADLGAGWQAMNEWKLGIHPEAEAPATRHKEQLQTGEGSTTSESTPTHAAPGEPHSGGSRLSGPSPLAQEAHYPEGLVEFDLDARGAQRSYRASLTEDPSREAGIWMNPQTREYVVVQGGRDFVETEWMNSSDMLRAGRRPNWRLVEHYHPDAQWIDRLPSCDDFQSITHWQTTGAEAPHELTSNIRYTDPETHIAFTTRFGYTPRHARPYWVEYRSPTGSLITHRFRDLPWNPGSEYARFLEGFSGKSASKLSLLPSGKNKLPTQTSFPQVSVRQPSPAVKAPTPTAKPPSEPVVPPKPVTTDESIAVTKKSVSPQEPAPKTVLTQSRGKELTAKKGHVAIEELEKQYQVNEQGIQKLDKEILKKEQDRTQLYQDAEQILRKRKTSNFWQDADKVKKKAKKVAEERDALQGERSVLVRENERINQEIYRTLHPVGPKLGEAHGGAYDTIPTAGGEVHHIPSDAVSPLSRNKGPCIWMEKADHVKTKSWGSSKQAQQWQATQKRLIKEGKFREAVQMDIDDIRAQFGNKKYEKGIQEMLDYIDTLDPKDLVPKK